MLQQQLDQANVAFGGGDHQGGAAVAVLQVDLRAALDQHLDHPLVAFAGGVHQQRYASSHPILAPTLAGGVRSPATRKPNTHRHFVTSQNRRYGLSGLSNLAAPTSS